MSKLTLRWSEVDQDWVMAAPSGHAPDIHLLFGFQMGAVSWPELKTALAERGYDLSTLRLEVEIFPQFEGKYPNKDYVPPSKGIGLFG